MPPRPTPSHMFIACARAIAREAQSEPFDAKTAHLVLERYWPHAPTVSAAEIVAAIWPLIQRPADPTTPEELEREIERVMRGGG